jgi:hypothetical protein
MNTYKTIKEALSKLIPFKLFGFAQESLQLGSARTELSYYGFSEKLIIVSLTLCQKTDPHPPASLLVVVPDKLSLNEIHHESSSYLNPQSTLIFDNFFLTLVGNRGY